MLRRICVLALLLAAWTVKAESEPLQEAQAAALEFEKKVEALLKSSDEKKQAWGAWYVASHRLVKLGPELRDLFDARIRKLEKKPPERWLNAHLDALIQTRTAAKSDTLNWLAEKQMDQWVVLLGQFDITPAVPLLREIALRNSYIASYAATNMLVKQDAKAFCAWTLPALAVQLKVTVKNGDHGTFGHRSGGGSHAREPDPLWPPLTRYFLFADNVNESDVVLAAGLVDVFYERRVEPESIRHVFKRGDYDAADYVVLNIRECSEIHGYEGPRTTKEELIIMWSAEMSVDLYAASVREHAEQIYLKWDDLRSALGMPDLRLPNLEIEISDRRFPKDPLLPKVNYDFNSPVVRPDGSRESVNAVVLRELRRQIIADHGSHIEQERMKHRLQEDYVEPARVREQGGFRAELYTRDEAKHAMLIAEVDRLIGNGVLEESGFMHGLIKLWREQRDKLDPEGIAMADLGLAEGHEHIIDVFERIVSHKKVSRRELERALSGK